MLELAECLLLTEEKLIHRHLSRRGSTIILSSNARIMMKMKVV
jgi:hypothetical protein